MQYLPHNAQQGPIQYLQLIPTRPLIVPISPYISGYNNPYASSIGGAQASFGGAQASYGAQPSYGGAQPSYGGAQTSYGGAQASFGGPTAQASSNSPYALPHHSYSPSTSNSYSSYGNSYSPSLQNPIGGYSTNYLTYFRPNHGMQLVNSPVDLSLNTNEYIPIQSENTYKMRRV